MKLNPPPTPIKPKLYCDRCGIEVPGILRLEHVEFVGWICADCKRLLTKDKK